MKYWKRVDGQGSTTTVESYSHSLTVAGAVEITKAQYDAFIASLPTPEPVTERDWKADYQAASTTAAKLDVIAQRTGLK